MTTVREILIFSELFIFIEILFQIFLISDGEVTNTLPIVSLVDANSDDTRYNVMLMSLI